MKLTQLLILLLLPLTGFTQNIWDYDSLPKRNQDNLRFTGYSEHITDNYFINPPKKDKKVKAIYNVVSKREERNNPCNLSGKPIYERHYDTLGRKTKEINRYCILTIHTTATKDAKEAFFYHKTDSFYVVTQIHHDTVYNGQPIRDIQTEYPYDTFVRYYNINTGYLVKQTSLHTNYTVIYTYDEQQRLKTINYPSQDRADEPIEYRYSYRYDTLEKDTIVLWVGKEKVYLRDTPKIILDDVTTTYIKYYFVNGIEVCKCGSHGYFHKHALIKKRLWWLYRRENQEEEYKNKICDKWESETLYPLKINKRKTRKQYRYEYY